MNRWTLGGTALAAAASLPWLLGAYPISLLTTVLVMALLAMSTQLLAGLAGLASLGQVAYFGIGAYTAALLADRVTTAGPVHLVAATAAGALAAAVTGPLMLRTRGTPFLMVTFAMGQLVHTLAVKWTDATGGTDGLATPAVAALPGTAELVSDGYAYLYVLGWSVLVGGALIAVARSRLGLALRGCADSEPRMAASGHSVGATLWAGYTVAGAAAGAAGGLLIAADRYVSPADIGFDVAALTLLAAVIGNRSMLGAAAGAAVVWLCRDWLGGIFVGHAPALLGALFLLVAYLRPWATDPARRGGLGRRLAATVRR